jgi:hypothetical protein
MPRLRGSQDPEDIAWHRLNLLKLSRSSILDLKETSKTTIPRPVLNLAQRSIGYYAEFAIQGAVVEIWVETTKV